MLPLSGGSISSAGPMAVRVTRRGNVKAGAGKEEAQAMLRQPHYEEHNLIL